MRCFIRSINGNWHAAFGYGGIDYTHALRTKDEKEAEVRIGPIRDTLYRLENGTLSMPPDADPKAFILSGGRTYTRPTPVARLTIRALADLYMAAAVRIEANTRLTKTIHLNHVARVLGDDTPVASIRQAEIQKYAKARCASKHNGRTISGYTIAKELRTFHQACKWAASERHTPHPPAWVVGAVDLPKDRGREPFRTFAEINRIIERGGTTEADHDRLWECLYLNGEEVSRLLDFVRDNATAAFVHPMTACVALTGCRRAEMARSLIDDWDLAGRRVHVREKKADTSVSFTMREIDVHPKLAAIMTDWFADHPGGRHAFTLDGKPLSVDQASGYFKRTLQGHPMWSKIPGFHTLRHSLASILASKGTDQRYVDKILGHQTEAMRKRYQHLFPRGAKDAIDNLL